MYKEILKNLDSYLINTNFSRLLNLSKDSLRKLKYFLTLIVTSKIPPNELNSLKTTKSNFKKISYRTKVKIYLRLLFLSLLMFLKYFVLASFFKTVFWNSHKNPTAPFLNEIKYVIFNCAGAIDRIDRSFFINLNKTNHIVYYLYSKKAKSMIKHLKFARNNPVTNNQVFPLLPVFPNVKTLKYLLNYAFQYGPILEKDFSSLFMTKKGRKNIIIFHFYLCSLLVHSQWAKKISLKISKQFPNSIFIFDQDHSGKELMLAECLNSLGKKTVLIQHGIMTDPNPYIPTCKFMFCCSIREKQLLIDQGISSDRIFIIGAPLQTINDSLKTIFKHNRHWKLLILAGQGGEWLQKSYIEMILKSNKIVPSDNIAIRLHPRFNVQEKRMWQKYLLEYYFAPSMTLGEALVSADLVVTFSLDTLISCLRKKKRVVICINSLMIKTGYFNFIKETPFINVATNSEELDNILKYLEQISEEKFASLISNKHIDDIFGFSDENIVKNNIKKSIQIILEGKY